MELQTVKTGKERLIASGASIDGISIRRTGIAKVLWRKLDVDIPKSEVIANGVKAERFSLRQAEAQKGKEVKISI